MVWGILGALDTEVALIKQKMDIRESINKFGTTFYRGTIYDHDVVLVCCGIGKVNAAVCASTVISEFGADFLINVGIAGAMKSGLNIMDIIISNEVAFHDQDPVMLNYYPKKKFFSASPALVSLCENACMQLPEISSRYQVGRIVSGDVFVNDSETKNRINENYAPCCVEMEGASIGHVSTMYEKPFLVIRTMSDCADDHADNSYDNFIDVAAHQSAEIILKMLEIG